MIFIGKKYFRMFFVSINETGEWNFIVIRLSRVCRLRNFFFYMQLIQWLWLNRRNILETSFISAQWYHCNWIAQHVKLLSKPFDKAENYMDDGKMFIKHVIAHLLAFSMNGQCDITSIFDHFRLLETHSCFHSAQGAWEGFHFLIYFYNVF